MSGTTRAPDARLEVMPTPYRLVRGVFRRSAPFVMVNLLAFKVEATGAYTGMSGREAYGIYADSVAEIQRPMGSKLYWAGDVVERYEPASPFFEMVAFLEYSNPRSFLRFAARGGSNTAARKAGLLGQWLLASTTLHHGPSTHGPMLVEVLEAEPWVEDGEVIWSGRVDHRIIGKGPRVTHVIATRFESTAHLEVGIAERRRSRPNATTTWWPYRAETSDFGVALR